MAATTMFSIQYLDAFRKIAGDKFVLIDEESLNQYAHDETEDLHFIPEVVIKPRTAEEISAILKICNKEKIPVTAGRRYWFKWWRITSSRWCIAFNRKDE